MNIAEKLAAPQIRKLIAYQSARRIGGSGKLYLNANESPYPAYQMPDTESWQRYPDFLPNQLAHAYARYACVPGKNTLAVRGADEAIDLLIRSFCEPAKDSICINSPSYAMYEFIARAHQVAIKEIRLKTDFELDLEQNLQNSGSSKLIFLCHPNNPTGNLFAIEEVLQLADRHKEEALVVVDEAYIEFCPQHTLASEIAHHENLIILRTLSKAFALAAVRLGFLIAHESVIEMIGKLIAPYPIPDPSARIGLNALSDEGIAFMQQQRDRLNSLRIYYQEELANQKRIKKIYPSAANFLLVEFDDGPLVFDHLQQKGIIVRDQQHAPGLANHLRITIGDEGEMEQLLDCLGQLD